MGFQLLMCACTDPPADSGVVLQSCQEPSFRSTAAMTNPGSGLQSTLRRRSRSLSSSAYALLASSVSIFPRRAGLHRARKHERSRRKRRLVSDTPATEAAVSVMHSCAPRSLHVQSHQHAGDISLAIMIIMLQTWSWDPLVPGQQCWAMFSRMYWQSWLQSTSGSKLLSGWQRRSDVVCRPSLISQSQCK